MPFPLPEDFKPGAPLRDLVTTEIMKTVAGILNHLTVEVREGVDYPYIEKTARPGGQQPWVIVLPAPAAPADAGPDLADTTPLADDDPASAGTAETASRSDHAHPLNVDDETTPKKDAPSGAVGTSAAYVRADHAHPLNVDDGTTPANVAASGAVGTSAAYARADHVHGISLSVTELSDESPSHNAGGATGLPGISNEASRADHQHPSPIATMHKGVDDTIFAMQPDGTPHFGDVDLYSREDHSHPLNVYDELEALADNFASAGERAGEFPTYARTDHSHPANTAANPTAFQSRQDGLNNSGQPFGGADIGKGSCGTSGVYADATHSHRLNNMRDNNVVPPGSIPLPVGSNILGDLVDGAGAQVCWACRFGYGPGYASWDHVHPDRLPVAYGTGAYAFRQSQYVYDGSMTTTMRTKDTASFDTRSHVRMDIPVVTRVSMQFKPKTGDTQTYLIVFTRLLSFDYSGRLTAIGPEASSGFYD